MLITKEIILNKLATDQKWLERGVLAIYKRQTEDEKQSEQTSHSNGRGFAGCDARRGTRMAQWLIKGYHLDGKHLEKARKMMPKYAGQLLIVALERATA